MEGIDITLGFWLFLQRQPNLEKNNLWFLCSICYWYQTFFVICWRSLKIGLWLLLQSHMSLEKRLRLEGHRPLMFLRRKKRMMFMFNMLLVSNLDHVLSMTWLNLTRLQLESCTFCCFARTQNRVEVQIKSQNTSDLSKINQPSAYWEYILRWIIHYTLYSVYFQKLAENFWDTFWCTKKRWQNFSRKS